MERCLRYIPEWKVRSSRLGSVTWLHLYKKYMCVYIYTWHTYKENSRKIYIKFNSSLLQWVILKRKKGTFAFCVILNSMKNKDLEKRDADLIIHKNTTCLWAYSLNYHHIPEIIFKHPRKTQTNNIRIS